MNEQEIAAALDPGTAAETAAAEQSPGPVPEASGSAERESAQPAGAEQGSGSAESPAPTSAESPQGQDAERQRRVLAQRQRQAVVAEQLRRISELDPSVRSLEDLTRAENFERFYALVRKGNSLVDAYKLANFDRLTRSALEAERQRYRNRIDGLRHLSTPTGRGGLSRPVPADVAEQYRAINPGVSDEEIRAHWNRKRGR